MDGSVWGAAMGRRRGAARPPEVPDEAVAMADLGPAVRLARREGPGRTHKGYRPDPDNPKRLVYGARTAGPHHRLLMERRITPWAFEAAEAYARYWLTRETQRTPDPSAPRARRQPWERVGEMAADQVHASRRLREARAVLGPLADDAVKLVCVAEQPLYLAFGHLFPLLAGEKGPARQLRAAVVQGILVVALDILARRWRIGPKRAGQPGKRGAA
jgi:hypothetical protein